MLKQLKGKHVFWALIGFFAVVSAVNAVFMYLAVTTMPGLTEKNPYESGRTYNREIEKSKTQKELGWKVKASIERGKVEDWDRLVVSATDDKDAPLQAYDVKAQLVRPTTNAGAINLKLQEVSPGLYAVSLNPKTQSGQWQMIVEIIENGERKFRIEDRIILP